MSIAKPVIISEDDARGALAPEEGTVGDTLLPMLIAGIGLAVIGAIVVLMVNYTT